MPTAARTLEGVITGVQPSLRLYAASPDRLGVALRGAVPRGPEALRPRQPRTYPAERAGGDGRTPAACMLDRVALNGAAMQGLADAAEEQACASEAEVGSWATARNETDQRDQQAWPGSSPRRTRRLAGAGVQRKTVERRADAQAGGPGSSAYGAGLASTDKAYRKSALESFDHFMTGKVVATPGKPVKSGKVTDAVPKAPSEGGKDGPKAADAKAADKEQPFETTQKTLVTSFDRREARHIDALYAPRMDAEGKSTEDRLTLLAGQADNAAATGHGKRLNELLRTPRPPTALEGSAVIEVSPKYSRTHDYLDELILRQNSKGEIDDDDRHAALSYLRGEVAEAVRAEIKSSLGFWHDDTARIEAAMRNMTKEQATEFRAIGQDALEAAGGWWHLGGTDLKVVNALANGDAMQADALRAIDDIRERQARRRTTPTSTPP